MTDAVLFARLRELVDHRSPWHRSLWQVGTLTGLEEVVEYAESVAHGLSPDGLHYVCKSMRDQVGADVGLGDPANRERLRALLDRDKLRTEARREQLRYVARASREGYLERWTEALEQGDVLDVERPARLIASHLLDLGFSGDHLHGWLQQAGASDMTVAEWLDQAASGAEREPAEYDVLVPLAHVPPGTPSGPFAYLDSQQTRAWLVGAEGVPEQRPSGGLVLRLRARDPWSAVQRAADRVARAQARIAVGIRRSGTLATWGYAWVGAKPRRIPLADPRRRLLVPTLARQDLVYAVASDEKARAFDDALELAAQLAQGPSGAAIAGAWAAVEALLKGPGEKQAPTAADRMATIVACSFGRAELTQLAHRCRERGQGALAEKLNACTRMRDQAALIEEMLRQGLEIELDDAGDCAAISRVRSMILDPTVIERVRRYVAEAFRRLYNQRNLVMHSGYLRSVALAPTLRTLPPLLGAGLDRVAYGLFTEPRTSSAIELAARAEEELAALGTATARPLWKLLEPPR